MIDKLLVGGSRASLTFKYLNNKLYLHQILIFKDIQGPYSFFQELEVPDFPNIIFKYFHGFQAPTEPCTMHINDMMNIICYISILRSKITLIALEPKHRKAYS